MVGRPYHVPVMAETVVDLLAPASHGTVVDATFGGGGHTRALLAAYPQMQILALDRDPEAAAEAAGLSIRFVADDFRNLGSRLEQEGIDELDGAVFDLGVSSHQLDMGERGFSYRQSGPLDMRMGPDAGITADDVVNGWDRARLADALRRFGEERFAGRIAAAVVRSRPIADTIELARVVADAVPARARRHGHPARRTFQAIRIAVNDELTALAAGLDDAVRLLRPGGRVVVIAYHSLEDRIVKQRFAAGAAGCICPPGLPVCACEATAELRLLTRRPMRPGPDEVLANPRARSARLRAAEKAPRET
jgi:16S rRNA (cytosine1402-N4)-methyltransferase